MSILTIELNQTGLIVSHMGANLDLSIDRPYVPAGESSQLHTSITIEPGVKQGSAERQVIVCIDASGSMGSSIEGDADSRIEAATSGADMVLGLLNEQDHFGLISFDSNTEVHISPDRWASMDRNTVSSTLDNISARGGTDIYSALEEAGSMFDALPDGSDVVREILLLSDGEDNSKDAPAFEPLATKLREEHGVSVVSAGVGQYDQQTIKTIGSNSGGRYEHVSSASDIMQFFGDEVEMIEGTIATNPRLLIETDAAIEVPVAYRRKPEVQEASVNYENGNPYITLPDLLDRQEQKVAFKLQVPEREYGDHTIGTVKLEAGSVSAQSDLSLKYTEDQDELSYRDHSAFLEFLDSKGRIELEEGNVEEAELAQETMVSLTGDTEVSQNLEEVTNVVKESDDEDEYKEAIDEATKVD